MSLPSTTGSQAHFSTIPGAQIERSKFDRSSGTKTSFSAGELIPIWCDEALPGDTFNLKMSTFARMATPIKPVLDNMYLDSFFFAVPIRLLWSNWEKFNGAQDDPGDSTDFTIPVTTPPGGGWGDETLGDYLGIPIDVTPLEVSALWFRAYNLIWNEWFRDENLQDSLVFDTDDGPDDPADYVLQRRGKRRDYFSSCLPWPQKGTAVQLPLGSSAPVVATGDGIPLYDAGDLVAANHKVNSGFALVNYNSSAGSTGAESWNDPKLETDLSSATAATINQLREGFQIQRLFERDARGGTRYTEIVRSHFGVVSPDERLQRPEYLGGGGQQITFTAVPQVSGTFTGSTAQGNVGGYATSSSSGHGFTKSFTEHCVLIGMVSVRADLNYQQGLPRMFSRQTRWDYYWPALSHLGEQGVLNKEIYADGSANDDLVFGYQERYAEYRYKPSQITGGMRSQATPSWDIWHLAQDFSSLPLLNASFIEDAPPILRIKAVAGEADFLFDAFFKLHCARPMPTYGVPGMIDHF